MTLLEELQTSIGELAGRVGPSVVGLGRRWGGSGVVVAPGRVLPLHAGASQKALLAFMPSDVVDAICDGQLEPVCLKIPHVLMAAPAKGNRIELLQCRRDIHDPGAEGPAQPFVG